MRTPLNPVRRGRYKAIRKLAQSRRCENIFHLQRKKRIGFFEDSQGGWVAWRRKCLIKASANLWGGGQYDDWSNHPKRVSHSIWAIIWFRCGVQCPFHENLKSVRKTVVQKFSTQQQDDVSGQGKQPISMQNESERAGILLSSLLAKASSDLKCPCYLQFLCTWSLDWVAP